ncbi:MAG: hypothetical protein ACUZ8I_05090 [Candidatus Scalindua sp.]
MRKIARYTLEFYVDCFDREKADLVRAALCMHTRFTSMCDTGLSLKVCAGFDIEENAEIAKKEINERFFN